LFRRPMSCSLIIHSSNKMFHRGVRPSSLFCMSHSLIICVVCFV
jgi:hypothetical protein